MKAAAIILLLAPALHRSVPAQSRAQAPEPHFYKKAGIRMSLDIVNNLPYVYLSVNGSEPLPFLVDSGMELSALSEQTVGQLGLRTHLGGELRITGNGGFASTGTWASPVRLIAGRHEVLRGTLPVIDLIKISQQSKMPIAGVLGFDVLKAHTAILDFKNGEMLVFRKPLRKELRNATFVSGRCGASPSLDASFATHPGVKPLPARFMLDTGLNASIMISQPFARDHEFAPKDARKDVEAFGLGAEFSVFGGLTATLTLGGTVVQLDDIVVSQATEGMTASTDYAGLIGVPLLDRYRVAFNCPEGTVVLME